MSSAGQYPRTMRIWLALAITVGVILGSCSHGMAPPATPPIPPPPVAWSIDTEMERDAHALGDALDVMASGDSDLDRDEQAQARIVRAASALVFAFVLMINLPNDEARSAAGALAKHVMNQITARRDAETMSEKLAEPKKPQRGHMSL